jgi:hypothetical protein
MVSTGIATTIPLWFGGYSIVTATGAPAVLAAYLYDSGGTWEAYTTVVDTVNATDQDATVRIYYTYTA